MNQRRFSLIIEPSSIARRAIAECIPYFKEKLDRQGMRWIDPDRLHLRVASWHADEIESILPQIEAHIGASPRLEVGKLKGMPDHKRPGSLLLGITDPSGNLAALQAGLESVLPDAVIPFFPLSTMKPASTKLGHRLRDYIHSGKHPEDVSWIAEELRLIETLPSGETVPIRAWKFR